MKKTLVLFTMIFAVTSVIAQPIGVGHEKMERKREKIEAIKAAYITEALDLSVEESQQFWPVYNELHKKELALRKNQHREIQSLDGDKSEKDIEVLIYALADIRINLEQLRKSYLDDFIIVLGAKKTAKLMKVEMEFGRKMMEQMKRSERPQHGEKHPKPEGRKPR